MQGCNRSRSIVLEFQNTVQDCVLCPAIVLAGLCFKTRRSGWTWPVFRQVENMVRDCVYGRGAIFRSNVGFVTFQIHDCCMSCHCVGSVRIFFLVFFLVVRLDCFIVIVDRVLFLSGGRLVLCNFGDSTTLVFDLFLGWHIDSQGSPCACGDVFGRTGFSNCRYCYLLFSFFHFGGLVVASMILGQIRADLILILTRVIWTRNSYRLCVRCVIQCFLTPS